ncbi:GTP-binding protein ypt1 [Pelomyxa schiedti]|nr:GTP-binding protein ypt1 [Pelomyxa schiedti]
MHGIFLIQKRSASLLFRMVDNQFHESPPDLGGADYRTKQTTVGTDNVRMDIWDTAGQERFRTITSSYYKNAHGVVIVYDATDPQSFENVTQWATDIQHYASEAIKILVATKTDLPVKVETEKGKQFADDWSLPFMEVSAKTGAGVDQLAQTISQEVHSRWGSKPKPDISSIKLTTDRKVKKGEKGCCN